MYFIYCSSWKTIAGQIINKPAFMMCDVIVGLAQFTTRGGVCFKIEYCKIKEYFVTIQITLWLIKEEI